MNSLSEARSPESVLSLEKSSLASNNDKGAYRVLFLTPDKALQVSQPEEQELLYESDDSTASFSLTQDGIDPQGVVTASIRARESVKMPAVEFTEDITNFGKLYDESVEANCHGGLDVSHPQMAGAVGMFFRPQPSPPPVRSLSSEPLTFPLDQSNTDLSRSSAASEASTTLTCNTATKSPYLQLDIQDQGLSTSKQIVRSDLDKILTLKHSLQSLAIASSTQQREFKILEYEFIELAQEREVLKEREQQHLDSIAFLKERVGNLLKSNNDRVALQEELSQLQLENDAFATQIIENEIELRVFRSTVKALCEENQELKRENQNPKAISRESCSENICNSIDNTVLQLHTPTISGTISVEEVRSLELRLASLEGTRQLRDNIQAETIEKARRLSDVEERLAEIQDYVIPVDTQQDVEVSLIEAIGAMQVVVASNKPDNTPETDDSCSSWFCECLPKFTKEASATNKNNSQP
jgi:hypothetical protein